MKGVPGANSTTSSNESPYDSGLEEEVTRLMLDEDVERKGNLLLPV